jgi:C2H2-type zinc finger
MAEPAPQQPEEQQPNAYVCPECGRSFTRPQALGAHRSRTHGVAGTSRSATSQKRPIALRATSATANQASSSQARRRSPRRRSRGASRGSTTTQKASVNRDLLLGALFPNGIPPRQDVIRAVNAWLDAADRLRAMR